MPEVLSFTDTVVLRSLNSPSDSFTDSVALYENFSKAFFVEASETITVSEVFAKVGGTIKSFEETVTVSDILSKVAAILDFVDYVGTSDVRALSYVKIFEETVNTADVISKGFTRSFSDTITLIHNDFGKLLKIYNALLFGKKASNYVAESGDSITVDKLSEQVFVAWDGSSEVLANISVLTSAPTTFLMPSVDGEIRALSFKPERRNNKMQAGIINLVMEQGALFSVDFYYKDANEDAIDLTGYGALLTISPYKGATTKIAEIEVGTGLTITMASGKIHAEILSTVTAGYSFNEAYYDLVLVPSTGSGRIIRLCEGKIRLIKEA